MFLLVTKYETCFIFLSLSVSIRSILDHVQIVMRVVGICAGQCERPIFKIKRNSMHTCALPFSLSAIRENCNMCFECS